MTNVAIETLKTTGGIVTDIARNLIPASWHCYYEYQVAGLSALRVVNHKEM